MENSKFNVLYVDDEEANLTVFKAAFRKHYVVHTALSAREGIKILKENPVDLIVTDQRMPQMTGVQFLEAVIPEYPMVIRMILTGFSDVEAIIKAINGGRVYRYITKPWDETDLKITIDKALEVYDLQKRNRELLEQLHVKVMEQERILKTFQKFVPENVVQETLSTKSDESMLSGESRIVAVLFSDIRNFTSLTENLDPKDVVAFLNDYFTLMTDSVKNNKGSVNKFIGDGVLAIFGAPVSYIENPENAVRCGLDMIEQLKKFNASWSKKLGRELQIGIGINTGEVIAGNIGSEEKLEYTVIGDTVNVASRIESLTKNTPNGILISASTHEDVSDVFECKEWEAMDVKGKSEKVKVYQVIKKKE